MKEGRNSLEGRFEIILIYGASNERTRRRAQVWPTTGKFMQYLCVTTFTCVQGIVGSAKQSIIIVLREAASIKVMNLFPRNTTT